MSVLMGGPVLLKSRGYGASAAVDENSASCQALLAIGTEDTCGSTFYLTSSLFRTETFFSKNTLPDFHHRSFGNQRQRETSQRAHLVNYMPVPHIHFHGNGAKAMNCHCANYRPSWGSKASCEMCLSSQTEDVITTRGKVGFGDDL